MLRVLVIIIILSSMTLIARSYLDETAVIPHYGGHYQEGLIGQPRFINPLLSQTNDADRDMVQLVFSGLLKYDGQGNLQQDLAESYAVLEDGLVYDFTLKENIFFHDGEPLSADDVIYTIKTIQDPEYKSPLNINWQGVQVEKVDERTIRFILNNTYAPFLHNLTVGILPKHRWQGISAANFSLAEYNLNPIGTGPYKIDELSKDEAGTVDKVSFIWNENYYGAVNDNINAHSKPYIERVTIKFYESEAGAIKDYNSGQIDGLGSISPANMSELNANGLAFHQIRLPLYYSVFFNQTNSKPLSDESVRLALNYATDKQAIIDQVLMGQGIAIDNALLPGGLGYSSDVPIYEFSLDKAKEILADNDWTDTDDDGILDKEINGDVSKLEITLVTIDWPELVAAANVLKQQWSLLNAQININIVDPSAIQQEYIRPRQYEALLFGEILGADPDPFAFWHSSRKKDPGLNLALYNNQKADKLLEEARQNLDEQVRQEKYIEFQKLVSADVPVVFLYSPHYIYPVDDKVKGIDISKLSLPSYRFSQIANWYIKTARIEK